MLRTGSCRHATRNGFATTGLTAGVEDGKVVVQGVRFDGDTARESDRYLVNPAHIDATSLDVLRNEFSTSTTDTGDQDGNDQGAEADTQSSGASSAKAGGASTRSGAAERPADEGRGEDGSVLDSEGAGDRESSQGSPTLFDQDRAPRSRPVASEEGSAGADDGDATGSAGRRADDVTDDAPNAEPDLPASDHATRTEAEELGNGRR